VSCKKKKLLLMMNVLISNALLFSMDADSEEYIQSQLKIQPAQKTTR
jgi:hypothetical protein